MLLFITRTKLAMSHLIINVLPNASSFLDLLYDLGYLNERLLRKINKRLLADETSEEFLSFEQR